LKFDYHKNVSYNVILINYINKIYNYYYKNRHSLFHWRTPFEGKKDITRCINNKNEADELIKLTLLLINEYYLLLKNKIN
jgi:hypothetical protein